MAFNIELPGGATARKVVMAAGTFSVAMAVGFFMQQGGADAARTTTASALPDVDLSVTDTAQVDGAAIVEVAAASPANLPQDPELNDAVFERVVAESTEVVAEPLLLNPSPDPVDATPVALQAALAEPASCDPEMSAAAQAAALVTLTVTAPCHADQAFTLHHEGLMFTVRTDTDGAASVIAPAMADTAVYIAAFDDGLGAVADVTVPDLAEYERVILQWQGQSGFEVHAMEFGASYGQTGHVWRDAARDATAALEGQGGFLMQLGDFAGSAPLMAEVYTFPRSNTPQAGTVALSVEAEITAQNCATDISAQTLERTADARVRIADLTLSMPECAAIGEFLVMQDLLSDLTLAQG